MNIGNPPLNEVKRAFRLVVSSRYASAHDTATDEFNQWLNRNDGLLIRAQAMSCAAVRRVSAACLALIATSLRSWARRGSMGTGWLTSASLSRRSFSFGS